MSDPWSSDSSDSHSHPAPAGAQDRRFPIAGIGASAGGLDACTELLEALPPEPGLALVVVQHLEPHHESHLAEILSRATAMPVVSAEAGQRVERNHVYVMPPNAVLTIKDRSLLLSPRGKGPGEYYPIDRFFRSLADDQGTAAIGVVLSGSASDGTQGLKAIKCAGGTTLCQDEASAICGGMPHSAIAGGFVDLILPPGDLAIQIARIAKHGYPTSHPEQGIGFSENQADLQQILGLLRKSSRVDFTQYKQNTIRRRIARRMMLHNLETPREYLTYLNAHPGELEDLYREILISVTQFFREPDMYEALSRQLTELLRSREREAPFRVWVAGCATGEEVYSLAILLTELIEAGGYATPLQLFGTDISESAIDRARAATYPVTIQQEVSPERLRRFFTHVEGGYRIAKTIRESCVFARHDLTRDPPFSQLDLVSCRNVLIYLGAAAQRRVLQGLHYSLKPEGMVVLGSAESIGNRTDLFGLIDSDNKIFSRRFSPLRMTMTLPDPEGPGMIAPERKPEEESAAPVLAEVEIRATRLLRDLYAPPGVTINEGMQIVHFHGQTSLFLEPPSGEASLNVFRVAHPSLLFSLRKAIDTAMSRNEPVEETDVRFERGGESREITLRVIPITTNSLRYYLVLFEHGPARGAGPRNTAPEIHADGGEFQLAQTRRELDEAREYLRKVIGQHEVAIRELRAAHEEVQSSNEEMQSTNEELRTAKEELQSSNEELITVNEELKNLNNEISDANSDLSNVLDAVSLPIVMVGMDLRIRRYTPSAERLLNTVASDLGRPITDLACTVQLPNLEVMLTDAIQTLAVRKVTVQNRDGRWFSVVVRPYRTIDDRIAGAVITFIDVDDVTRALERAESARDFAEGMVETVQHPLLVLDHELRVERVTSAFYRVFQVEPRETQGMSIFSLGNGQWNIPRLRRLLEEAMVRDVPFRDMEVDYNFPHIGRRTMRLNARRIAGRDRNAHKMLLAIEDVTERKEAAEIQYRRIFETAKDGILIIDGTFGIVSDANPFFLGLTRCPREEIVGRAFWDLPAFRQAEEGRRLVPETLEKEVTRYDAVRLQAQDGTTLMVELIANCYRVRDQVLIQVNVRDVTDRRQAEEDLRRSNLDLQQFAFAASHDLQEPLRTVISQVQLLQKLYTGKMGPEADQIVQFITTSTDRMRQMVLDLLSFAQTARAEITIVPVSVEGVLAMAIGNLQLAIENTGARITFDPLPTVLMDETQLLRLLQNLMGNALKYRSEEPPRIHLSALPAGGEWIFTVEDNGIGIAPRFHEHIFTVFKRLHGREYPGTGIGLATCKRIVERHGGRIWVESEEGKGSKFFFTARAVKQ